MADVARNRSMPFLALVKSAAGLTSLCLLIVAGCSTSRPSSGRLNNSDLENKGSDALVRRAAGPLVIGHRGAAGYLPEHTLQGYSLAIDMGADFVEPDLVSTKDHVPIARHENEISGTTDVAIKFPKRKATHEIDGEKITGWFANDFTLKEIKTLRAKERLAFRDHSHDGLFQIPTLEEILQLVARREAETGRIIGVYPEIKHSTFHQKIGLPLEDLVVKILAEHGYVHKASPAIIQSAEIANLRYLRGKTELRLLQLIGGVDELPYDTVAAKKPLKYTDMITPQGLAEIATYADGIGPDKTLIVPVSADRHLLTPTSLVGDAHKVGLFVHPYTFRNESEFLSPDYHGDPKAEYRKFYDLGVDGVFSDFADVAVSAR